MGTLFRLLCRHLRNIWHRARSLFFSIRLRILRINPKPSPSPSPSPSTAQIPMPTSSASRNFSTAKTKACQWACTRARDVKTRMTERRVARKNMMKQIAYARMTGRAVVQGTKKEDDGVVATSKYCAKAIDDDEDDEEANEEEDDDDENRLGTEAQGDGDNLNTFEALFKPLSSSPTLRFVASRRSRSPFPPTLSLLSHGLSTPDLLVPEHRLEVEPGYANAHALSSPSISCGSPGSRSCDTGSTPATPTTSQGLTFPFPTIRTFEDVEAVPVTPRLHLRPNPRPRIRFRTLSASITARSPLSLSFPLSLSLPHSTRRVFSSGMEMDRYMEEQGKQGEDGAKQHGRARKDVAEAAMVGEEERERIGDGEDPFGTHGRAYFAPHARAALGFGDAYDFSAWAWACDYPPYRRQKKRHGEKRHVRTGSATGPASVVTGVNIGGTGSVYSTPIYAASAPQLSCADCPDVEVEYLRAMAKAARARVRVERPPMPVRPGPSTHDLPGQHPQHAPGYKGGIRPLLLPQKLGLPGSGVPVPPREIGRTNDTFLSGGRGYRATGWERDLERGMDREGDGVEA